MSDLRAKACGYLRDAKVTIGAARRPKTSDRPDFVSARIVGHNGTYMVHLLDERWSCSCKDVVDDGEPCAHLAAVQLVTGWPSAAAKPDRVTTGSADAPPRPTPTAPAHQEGPSA